MQNNPEKREVQMIKWQRFFLESASDRCLFLRAFVISRTILLEMLALTRRLGNTSNGEVHGGSESMGMENLMFP